jgi:hypothetical protein
MFCVCTLIETFLIVGNWYALPANRVADVVPTDCPATKRPVNPGMMVPFVTGVVGYVGNELSPPFW